MSDHNHAGSGDMTVEDENRRNSETDDMHGILNNFMQAKEETLEELVGGFMYLTLDDVRQAASNAARVLVPNADADPVFRETDEDVETVPTTTVHKASGHTIAEVLRRGRGGDQGQTNDIEEEVLEDGPRSRHSCEDALFRHRPASLTKFDNFVLSEGDPESDSETNRKTVGDEEKAEEDEDGEGEEEDWLPASGYMASFATGTAAPEDVSHSPGTAPCVNKAQTIHQTPPDISSPSPPCSSAQHSTTVTLDAKESSPSNTGFSQQTEESVTIADSADTCCDSHSSVCEEEVEAPAWALNPGEAEDEVSSAPVTQRVSVIGISTTVDASVGTADSEESSGDADNESSNEVVPFELDEHYDYENVVYTPKFTQAEMNYLRSFLPHKS